MQTVILAAGRSSRANTNKLLLTLRGKTVIENCVEAFYDTCSDIIVVGGCRIDELKPVLRHYKNVKLVCNYNYKKGMFSSVKEGLRHITAEKFFITPADHAVIKKETIHKLCMVNSDIAIAAYKGAKGHPVLISGRYIDDILNNDYLSLRDFMFNKSKTIINTADIGVVYDIDTMNDYYFIKSAAEKQ